MSNEEIIKLATSLKTNFGTTDTIKLCSMMGIKIEYMNLNPGIYKAYTIHFNNPIIKLNNHFTLTSQKVLCAHELGHALLHNDNVFNQFNDDHNGVNEYQANLFAVALLFNRSDFNIDISKMDNYMLRNILDKNIKITDKNPLMLTF